METLRILWLNWRCIKHPLAGGAEVYTHEIAKRLAKMGHEVILATSRPGDLPKEEEIDGYHVIRGGGKYTVYLHARKIYHNLKREGWKPDIVVDEVNTIPFLTPKYAKEPIVMLIHQLCKDCWSYAVHPLVQPFGWWLEKKLHKIYIDAAKKGSLKSIITVSESTKKDLVELGYPEKLIHIVYNGLNWEPHEDREKLYKDREDLVAYIGRITPYKRLEDLIRAWRIVEQENSSMRLIIAGRAEPKYLGRLTRLKEKLKLRRAELKTNIPEDEKRRILAKAKVLVYTSTREGWGQTVLEANAYGIPVVGYDVPGLRDSIKHMKTGILVPYEDVKALAKAIIRLVEDQELWRELAENALNWAKQFNWDKSAEKFMKVLSETLLRET